MKATKDKGRREAQEIVRVGQHNRIAKENRRPGKDSYKSGGRKKQSKTGDENFRRDIIQKAVKYHKLKREVLAPFIAELLVIYYFDAIKSNLDSEATISHTFLENINSDENSNRESSSPAPSFQDDWREDVPLFSESD